MTTSDLGTDFIAGPSALASAPAPASLPPSAPESGAIWVALMPSCESQNGVWLEPSVEEPASGQVAVPGLVT